MIYLVKPGAYKQYQSFEIEFGATEVGSFM
ncbi:MAG: hypothetical protein JWM04_705 [Verrucomicrobiales bacterium]|nr:hypothetical protein [Verrucomicrobiales bacterium]